MSYPYAIINGDFVRENEAGILISDLSIQRGYGIFDYFRTANNQPIFLADHLKRFYFSAAAMHLNTDLNQEKLTGIILELMEQNDIPDAGIRITLTGGYSGDGYTLEKPNLIITQSPFSFNKTLFNKGIRLVTYEHLRHLPEVKTINYLQAIYLQPFIKENGADDVLYFHQQAICECPRANFFIVNGNEEVITPSANILKGITRNKILEFSEFKCREDKISLQDLYEAREAFITSTTKNVLPVLAINGKQIGDGKPGKISSLIYQKMLSAKENGFL